MTKVLKILLRFIGITLEWGLILLFFVLFALRTSSFQTFLAKQATEYLSDELKTELKIGKVDFYFYNRLVIEDVFVLDQNKDTLADINEIKIKLKSFNNTKKVISIAHVLLNKGNVKIYSKNDKFNFQFIADYFSSEDTTSSEPFQINIHNLALENFKFKYDDYKYKRTDYGIDYNHISFKNLNLKANHIEILKDGGIKTHLRQLAFEEQSGLKMNYFHGDILFNNKGLDIKQLSFKTNESIFRFPKLALKVNSLDDFSDFSEKVIFDVTLKKSIISLKDVAYFVPDLKGMSDKILLETNISNNISKLNLKDFGLRYRKKTRLFGDFHLVDFTDLKNAAFNQQLKYANLNISEIEKLTLPESSAEKHINLPKELKKAQYVELKQILLAGQYKQFNFKAKNIKTGLGAVKIDHGIQFVRSKADDSYSFTSANIANLYDIKFDHIALQTLLNNNDLDNLNGDIKLTGEFFDNGNFNLNKLSGTFVDLTYLKHHYNKIAINDASFINQVFEGNIAVEDEFLNLSYNGFIDLKKQQRFNFTLDITDAQLDKLNLSTVKDNNLKSKIEVDVFGTELNNYSGNISLHRLYYQEEDKSFEIPSFKMNMNRSNANDILKITSNVLDAEINGKIDYATIGDEINNQFNKILPALFAEKTIKKKTLKSKFNYDIRAKNLEEVLAIFLPDLIIENGASIKGNFNSEINDFNLNIAANKILYDSIEIQNLQVNQQINEQGLIADYKADKITINDSLHVDYPTFSTKGTNDEMLSTLLWNPNTSDETKFSWQTVINDINSYFFNLNPSYFVIKHHKWQIENNSQVLLAPHDISIQNFKMERNNQYVTIDGCISEQNHDILKVDIHDLELEDFTSLFNLPYTIKGELNATAAIADPFQDVSFTSDVKVRDLKMDKEEIGDINLKAGWGKKTQSLDLAGELFYKKNKTFDFKGNYFLEKESFDFLLDFNYTDIQFANAFMDPQVVSGLRGLIDGDLHIFGTADKPVVEGEINMLGGNAKVEMFGVNFGFNGVIKTDQYGFYIDNMPIMDEEGNMGALVGTVFHNNFSNFSFDLFFNLEDDAFALQNGLYNKQLNEFLVMNTKYKEGEIYYGKAYATGTANIAGYADNLSINVDLKTRKGTQINFPMYGASDIEEGKFIQFTSDLNNQKEEKQELDLTGLNMLLNFKVTPDAQLKIIFDPSVEDEITAYGSGEFTIDINNIGDVQMKGVYTIADNSLYNFVYPPIVKEKFIIQKGGTITWTGDPLDAKLDLKTYNKVITSTADLMPSIESNAVEPKQVNCYLNLTQSLLEPLITLDIDIPNATENDLAALNRVKADKDQLNKQFFSLLIVKKFQPIDGTLSAGAGAGFDLLSGQLEEVLNNFSGDIRFNVNLNKDIKAIGIERKLLNDKLIVKTSLGVENASAEGEGSGSNQFVGDVNLEYLINEDGTFRVSVFNESNENTVIQEKSLGLFTQGAGLSYQEEFNNFEDFKMVQYFLDVFRKKKRYPIKKKKKLEKIPN